MKMVFGTFFKLWELPWSENPCQLWGGGEAAAGCGTNLCFLSDCPCRIPSWPVDWSSSSSSCLCSQGSFCSGALAFSWLAGTCHLLVLWPPPSSGYLVIVILCSAFFSVLIEIWVVTWAFCFSLLCYYRHTVLIANVSFNIWKYKDSQLFYFQNFPWLFFCTLGNFFPPNFSRIPMCSINSRAI